MAFKTINELTSIASESLGILKALTWHADTLDENVRDGLCPVIDVLDKRLKEALEDFDEIELVDDEEDNLVIAETPE